MQDSNKDQIALFRELYLLKFKQHQHANTPLEKVRLFQQKIYNGTKSKMSNKYHIPQTIISKSFTCMKSSNNNEQKYNLMKFRNSIVSNFDKPKNKISNKWEQLFFNPQTDRKSKTTTKYSSKKQRQNINNKQQPTEQSNKKNIIKILQISQRFKKKESPQKISKRVIIGGHNLQQQGQQHQQKNKQLSKSIINHTSEVKINKQKSTARHGMRNLLTRYEKRRTAIVSFQKPKTTTRRDIEKKQTQQYIDLKPWGFFEHEIY